MSQKTPPSTVAVNKKARHLYELSDFTEAGIMLTGPEVKSIRAGKVNFIDSYVDFRQGEAWLVSLHIAPYSNAGYAPQEPDRARKLLLHEQEIAKFSGMCVCCWTAAAALRPVSTPARRWWPRR